MELGFLKAVAFSGPLLIFLAWQLYSINRELDEEDDNPASKEDR